ncbi:unnamed protein product, partial [Iphiclides podalirius]
MYNKLTSIGSTILSKSKRFRMKTFILVACLILSAYAAEKYNSKYDNFDVDTLTGNDRLLKSYINCFLEKGKCTSEGTDFKKALPEAVETSCGKCTEKQKSNVRKVIKAIQQKFPKQWEELVAKNDPTGLSTSDLLIWVNGWHLDGVKQVTGNESVGLHVCLCVSPDSEPLAPDLLANP